MSGWEFSPSVLTKARRYLKEHRVEEDPEQAGVFWVTSERREVTRTYRVQTDADPERMKASWINCTCPHGSHLGMGSAHCAHAVAVLLAVRDRLTLPVRDPG